MEIAAGSVFFARVLRDSLPHQAISKSVCLVKPL